MDFHNKLEQFALKIMEKENATPAELTAMTEVAKIITTRPTSFFASPCRVRNKSNDRKAQLNSLKNLGNVISTGLLDGLDSGCDENPVIAAKAAICR